MNAWKFRHEGSPVASADLPFDQMMQGLIDGKIHPEDEVKGPNDTAWVKFEDHPAFAEIVSELEPVEEPPHDEETNLDMNPMIDVALVLLVFFILTTTYASLQKIIEAAEATRDKSQTNVRVVPRSEIENTMVYINAVMQNDRPVIYVDKEVVSLDDLENVLRRHARDPNRRTVLLEHDAKVPHGVVIKIQDKAKSGGRTKVLLLVPNS